MASHLEIAIDEYMQGLPEATPTEISAGSVLVRTSAGAMKKGAGDKFESIFEATSATTYAQISAAISAGKTVIYNAQGNIYQLNETVTANGYTFERTFKLSNGKVYVGYVNVTEADVWTSQNTEMAKSTDINVISDVPMDGEIYARKHGAWDKLEDFKSVVIAEKKVTINGKEYSYYKYGGYYWMAEDLDENFEGITSYAAPNGGKLYDISTETAFRNLQSSVGNLDVPTGWHLPDNELLDSGCFAVSGNTTQFTMPNDEKFNDTWGDFHGNDKFNMSVQQTGNTTSMGNLKWAAHLFGGSMGINFVYPFMASILYSQGTMSRMAFTPEGETYANSVLPYFTEGGIQPRIGVRLVCKESDFVEPTSTPGKRGLVPGPTLSDTDGYLSSSGTWKPVETFKGVSINRKVTIGSKQYGYCKVGHYYWMTEDLDEELEGVTYFDAPNGGKLYSITTPQAQVAVTTAVKALSVPAGWKLPDQGLYDDNFSDDSLIVPFAAATNDTWSPAGNNSSGLNFSAQQLECETSDNTYNQSFWLLDELTNGYSFICAVQPIGTELGYAWVPTPVSQRSNIYNDLTAYGAQTRIGVRFVCHEDDFVEPVPTPGKRGLVPAPGENDVNKFLSSDGTFKVVGIDGMFYYSLPNVMLSDGYEIYNELVVGNPEELYQAWKSGKNVIGVAGQDDANGQDGWRNYYTLVEVDDYLVDDTCNCVDFYFRDYKGNVFYLDYQSNDGVLELNVDGSSVWYNSELISPFVLTAYYNQATLEYGTGWGFGSNPQDILDQFYNKGPVYMDIMQDSTSGYMSDMSLSLIPLVSIKHFDNDGEAWVRLYFIGEFMDTRGSSDVLKRCVCTAELPKTAVNWNTKNLSISITDVT